MANLSHIHWNKLNLFHGMEIFWNYCAKRLENPMSIVLFNSILQNCCPWYGNVLEKKLPYCGRRPVFSLILEYWLGLNPRKRIQCNSWLITTITHSLSPAGEMSQTLHCTNGYKASYRRDLIPGPMKKAAAPMAVKRGQIASLDKDPNFGLFATGPDFSLKNGAVVVFACLNPK